MNTSPQGPTVQVVDTEKKSNGWVTTTIWSIAIIPALFALVFHLGAAYLSYQKYNSIGWAVLDFFFAVFYYPYYAFFLAKSEAPSSESIIPSMPTTVGARRKRMASKH
jgi:hypothetical protein